MLVSLLVSFRIAEKCRVEKVDAPAPPLATVAALAAALGFNILPLLPPPLLLLLLLLLLLMLPLERAFAAAATLA